MCGVELGDAGRNGVADDERIHDTAESIREDGGYKIVSGHRRKRACELARLESMPVIVRELDDAAATLVMVDSDIQRESLLPSEWAFAYKMKLDALKHQGENCNLL